MSQLSTRSKDGSALGRGRLKAAGLCGVAAPIVALSCIFLAISLSPWFSWSANALSDLGVGGAAWLFNSGLVVGGILTMAFAIGMLQSFAGRLRKLGAAVFLMSAISLMGIGVFSESAGTIHFYVSVAFFALTPISLLLMGAGYALAESKKFGLLTAVIGVLVALPWAFGWSAVAVPEMLSAIAATAWSAIQGVKLFSRGP